MFNVAIWYPLQRILAAEPTLKAFPLMARIASDIPSPISFCTRMEQRVEVIAFSGITIRIHVGIYVKSIIQLSALV